MTAAERRAAYIAEVLAAAPPLTGAQRVALAELLRPVRIRPEAVVTK